MFNICETVLISCLKSKKCTFFVKMLINSNMKSSSFNAVIEKMEVKYLI